MISCYAENCSSQKSFPSAGFALFKTNGWTIVDHCCMKNNSNNNVMYGGQSIFISSKKGQFLMSSVSFCRGTGQWAPSISLNNYYEVSSINSSFNSCRDATSIIAKGTGDIIFCNFVFNNASNVRIVHLTNTKLHLSNLANNTAKGQGLIFCENVCNTYVDNCSLVGNEGYCGFYACYLMLEISNMFVSNCSLVENSFTKPFVAETPCKMEYINNKIIKDTIILSDKFECDFKTMFIGSFHEKSYFKSDILMIISSFILT